MAELVAEEGFLKGTVYTLADREEWICGRDPDLCHIVLEDAKVSREHIVIKLRDDTYFVENLSLTNPALLNGVPIAKETAMQEGDILTIGSSVFHFYREKRELALEGPRLEEQKTIFREEEVAEIAPSLKIESRFILKVIGGPNAGAEYALEEGREYLLGSDTVTCDIVFHDLSVSREHARLSVESDGKIIITDLESRNGILVDRERIEGKKIILPNTQITLGTSVFFILDKLAPAATLVWEKEEPKEEKIAAEEVAIVKEKAKPAFGGATLILTLIIAGLCIFLGVALISLFREEPIHTLARNYQEELYEALKPFPAVRFTYNEATGKLFLIGHVVTAVERNELLHNLQGLTFLKGIEDNIIVDDAIWQETNLLLSKIKEFEGVSMHSPQAGCFVLTGYLKTNKQKSALKDFLNLNFLYLDLLEDNVVVEEEVLDEVESLLFKGSFNAVNVEFVGGTLTLTGYASAQNSELFQTYVNEFSHVYGVRQVRNFVVFLSPEQAVVDLDEKFPGRYSVTGYSKYGDVSLNVVINGRILMRGDSIDGMHITSIQPHTIFFEKDGLKYKLEYNK